jgi:type II secretory pathway pseudopilin PulG
MKTKFGVFTLVELLVVMAITALLLYIAMPTFEKMAKGGGVELAARNAYNHLSLARDYAITNRQYVAVLFPMKGDTDYPSSGVPSDYYNRSYRACIVNSSNAFQRWLPGENWEFTPAGVIVLDVGSDNSDDPINTPAHRNDTGVTTISMELKHFNDITGSTSSTAISVAAILFKPTGKTEGGAVGKYVEIGEGKHDPAAPDEIITTNKAAASLLTVTVAPYTGRVTYGED